MIPLVFAPHSRAGDFQTVPLMQVSEMIVDAMLGTGASRNWTMDDPDQYQRIEAAAIEAHEIVRDHLRSGALPCLIEPVGEAVLYLVPREYWQPKGKSFLEGDLSERLFRWSDSNVPLKFDEGAFLVDLTIAEEIAANHQPADSAKTTKPLSSATIGEVAAAFAEEHGRPPRENELRALVATQYPDRSAPRSRIRLHCSGSRGRPTG